MVRNKKKIEKLDDYNLPIEAVPNIHYYLKLFIDKINEIIIKINNE